MTPTGIINTIKGMIAPDGQFTRKIFLDVLANDLVDLEVSKVKSVVNKVISATKSGSKKIMITINFGTL